MEREVGQVFGVGERAAHDILSDTMQAYRSAIGKISIAVAGGILGNFCHAASMFGDVLSGVDLSSRSTTDASSGVGSGVKNVLPAGAKLDYRDEVDRARARMKKDLEEHEQRSAAVLKENYALMNDMRKVLDEQKKIFSSIGVNLGDPNPLLKSLEGKFDGWEDFTDMSKRQEMKRCELLGLAPKDGWEVAQLRHERTSRTTNTMGELSKILSSNRSGPSTVVAGPSPNTSGGGVVSVSGDGETNRSKRQSKGDRRPVSGSADATNSKSASDERLVVKPKRRLKI